MKAMDDLTGLKSVLSDTDMVIVQASRAIEIPAPPDSQWAKILRWLEVPHEGKPLSVLRNPDLEPIPIEERTWGFWSYFAYWALPNCSVGTLSTGSALLALDLNIKQSIGLLVISNLFIALYTALNSNPGSKYHIGYTLDQRLIFGIYGSYLGIIIRVGLSVVLYAYLAWMGGLCMNIVFDSFSQNYLNMKNTFPQSVPMTKKDFVGFLCFQLIQIPFAFVRPSRANVPSIVTSFMSLFAIIGMLAYLMKEAGGPGPLYYEKVTLSANERSWMWLFGITLWYSGVAAPVANQSDYSRFAVRGQSPYWGLTLGSMLLGVFVPTVGMIYASTSMQLYGEAYWTPDEIVGQWLADSYSAKTRAAAFSIGLSLTGSQIYFNLTQNGYSCGMDLAGIFPKYINICRGTLFVQLLSWVVQPWTFYTTATAFLNALGSFGIFTTPILTINVIEFYFIRKRKVPLLDFFTLSKKGAYWYTYGMNWRSMCSFFIGTSLGIPGLVYQVNTNITPNTAMMNFYYGYIFFSPIVTGGTYFIITYFFPVHHEKMRQEDAIDFFNCFTEEEREGMGMLPYDESIGEIYEYIDAQSDGKDDDNDLIESKTKFPLELSV